MRPTLAALLLASTTILGSACISGYEMDDAGGGDDTDDGSGAADCSDPKQVEGDLTFDSDAAIASSKEIPASKCWTLVGRLTLTGSDVTTLSGLNNLKSVNDLSLLGTGLTTFDSAIKVFSYGDVRMKANAQLASISNLEITRYLGEGATPGALSLELETNIALTDLGSLSTIGELNSDLIITGNSKLTAISLPLLTTLDGNIKISGQALTSIDLTGLTGALADVSITDAPHLKTLELGSISQYGKIVVQKTGLTTLSGFGSGMALEGAVDISNNSSLTSLTPFRGVPQIYGTVQIRDNQSLNACLVKEVATCTLAVGTIVNLGNQGSAASCNTSSFWCNQ